MKTTCLTLILTLATLTAFADTTAANGNRHTTTARPVRNAQTAQMNNAESNGPLEFNLIDGQPIR